MLSKYAVSKLKALYTSNYPLITDADKEADKLANKADAEMRDDCRELMHCFGEGRVTSSTTTTTTATSSSGGDSDSDELDATLVLPSSPPLNRTVMSRVRNPNHLQYPLLVHTI